MLYFFGVILVLCILLYLQHKEYSKQIREMTYALIARNSQELVDINHSVKKTPKEVVVPTDEIPLSELSDEAFLNAIGRDVDQEKDE